MKVTTIATYNAKGLPTFDLYSDPLMDSRHVSPAETQLDDLQHPGVPVHQEVLGDQHLAELLGGPWQVRRCANHSDSLS